MTDKELGEIRAHIATVAAGGLNDNLGVQRLVLRQDAPALFNYVLELRRQLAQVDANIEAVAVMIVSDLP
jgi:hypothetical protein